MDMIESAIETLSQFLDVYLELIYNTEERWFIDLERITWFDELEKSLADLKAFAGYDESLKEAN